MNHLQSVNRVNRSILLPENLHYGYLTTYSMMIHDWLVLPTLQLTGLAGTWKIIPRITA